MPANIDALPHNDTLAYTILETVALTGELPTDQIGRLRGNTDYKTKLLVGLRAQGLIHTFYRDHLRGHRLTAKAKELLLAQNNERFSFYITGGGEMNRPKSELLRRLRLHRMAEAILTMQNAGVAVFHGAKPDVFQRDDGYIPELPDIAAPTFFTSREVKEIGPDAAGIRGSRMVGVLLTSENIYVVYNTGDALMKWENKPELRAKTLMRVALCQQRLTQYTAEDIRGLVLGSGMNPALQLMKGTDGKKRNYFVSDGNYDHFHYLPNDSRGEAALHLLYDPHIAAALEDALSEGLYERDPGMLVENDAVTEDGAPVLFAYEMDMARITRFNMGLFRHERRGVLVCFDYQAEVLRRYCCGNVEIKTVSFIEFEGRFLRSR